MIKTVILDIGQVLAHFRWKEYIEDLGFKGEIADRIAKATVLSNVWGEIDRGKLTDEELIEFCCANDPELKKEIHEFFQSLEYIVEEYPYSVNWIKSLKEAGCNVYLLSNYGKTTFEYAKKKFNFLNYVDGSVISYQIKSIKPEPEIYLTLMQKYDIQPEEAVFLDDLEKNLATASMLGMKTIQFINLEDAIKKLDKIGIKCNMK